MAETEDAGSAFLGTSRSASTYGAWAAPRWPRSAIEVCAAERAGLWREHLTRRQIAGVRAAMASRRSRDAGTIMDGSSCPVSTLPNLGAHREWALEARAYFS